MFNWLWDCFFPIQCVGCRGYDTWLCQSCVSRLSQPGQVSGQSINRPDITTVYWLGDYHQAALRASIQGLKYQGWQGLAQPLGQALLAALLPRSYDAVIPIPLHPRRKRDRGFNQAQLLAEALPWPLWPALERYRWTEPQAQLNRQQRQINIQQAFRLTSVSTQLNGKTVLLVDDVFTTGATTHSCATLLRQAGCAQVDVGVLARD